MKLTTSEQTERVLWSIKTWNRLNFITATLRELEDNPKVISSRWTRFVKMLRRSHCPQLKSIRVLQKHPGGHGWHIHALWNQRVPAEVLLKTAEKCGLGRLDFRMVSGEEREKTVRYVVRYITRDMRGRWKDPTLKGVRLLTAAGHLGSLTRWWVRLCDVTVHCTFKELRKSLRSVLLLNGFDVPPYARMEMMLGLAPPAAFDQWRQMHPDRVF